MVEESATIVLFPVLVIVFDLLFFYETQDIHEKTLLFFISVEHFYFDILQF